MTLVNLLIPFLAAILGGALNAVAGGGSFLTFPSLVVTGVPAIQANTTSTVGLWPASAAAVLAFRRELVRQNKLLLAVLIVSSLIGGVGGAILLLRTPQATFVLLIPFLMLAATLLFAFSPLINARLRARRKKTVQPQETSADEEAQPLPPAPAPGQILISPWVLVRLGVFQLIIATYGGYFGGGIGILMLATLGLMGMDDIYDMNAIKNTLAATINGVAVITFIAAGAVYWANALIMIVGAMVGGYGCAYYARKIDQRWIRGFVILVGVTLTIYFLFKYNYL